MRPSIRQLEYLVAVAETLHFGRAAKQCAVTQPALSAQIQQLEELLGVQLFERGRRGVLVTPEGEAVIARARVALRELDELLDVARAARQPLEGPLRLGVIPTIAPYLLPPLLPRVREAHPRLALVLREDQTARLVAQLEAGSLDLLLLALPVEEAPLEELSLYEEPFVFAAPVGHRLAKGKARIPEAALADEEVLLLEDGHCLRAQALAVCERAGARESGRIQATSLGTLMQMVANGLGVTLLPERAVPVEVRPGAGDAELVVRPFREPAPSRSIGLAWRRGSAGGAEFHALGELLRREAKRLVPARRRAARSRQGRHSAAR